MLVPSGLRSSCDDAAMSAGFDHDTTSARLAADRFHPNDAGYAAMHVFGLALGLGVAS